MKAILIKTIFILFVTTSVFGVTVDNSNTVDPIKVRATFQGHDDYGYNFLFINDEGDEETITFEVIAEELLEIYNLNDKKFIDQEFEIVYDYETSENDDEIIEAPKLHSIKKIE
ncbi:hypothetical protein [Tenacibaculum sp.]|uniref:hypothetical protein n=1 Tax=Tenacibaculum sp. TaxID=1906242 RepID=UPI003D0A772F